MVAWETTLEDVLEDEDEEQDSVMDGTVLEAGGEEEDTTMEEDDKVSTVNVEGRGGDSVRPVPVPQAAESRGGSGICP